MPLNIIRADITKLKVDAIVNAANNTLLGGGGVDGAIHRAAGKKLLEECRRLGGCETGQAKITKGYDLPAKFVIHTVGPIWYGGNNNEKELLISCYNSSLRIAADKKLESIAFPLISSGAYGYPKDEALEIAVDTCSEFLKNHDMDITIVVYDKKSFDIGNALYNDVRSYIEERLVCEEPYYEAHSRFERDRALLKPKIESSPLLGAVMDDQPLDIEDLRCVDSAPDETDIEEALKNRDKSFTETLFMMIDERGLTDAECYHRANIDRKLFSKIRKPDYHPKKVTVIALAIALQLDMDGTDELLMKAGYALSDSSEFDIIIKYCIERKIYNVNRVNEILFKFYQALLGV